MNAQRSRLDFKILILLLRVYRPREFQNDLVKQRDIAFVGFREIQVDSNVAIDAIVALRPEHCSFDKRACFLEALDPERSVVVYLRRQPLNQEIKLLDVFLTLAWW